MVTRANALRSNFLTAGRGKGDMKKQMALLMLVYIQLMFTGCAEMGLYERLVMEKTAVQQESVRMTWLGTAGMFITDGKTGILIDPYVSRFSMSKVVFRSPLEINHTMIRKWAEKLGRENITAVIVSHLTSTLSG